MTMRVLLLVLTAGLCLAAPVLAEPVPGPSGDSFMGEYEGAYHWVGRPDLQAQGLIVAEGPGLYRMAAHCLGEKGEIIQVELHGQLEGPRVVFHGFTGSGAWDAEAAGGALHVHGAYETAFELKKADRHSPTEGQAPPKDAVVLLPYAPGKAPDLGAWTNDQWKAFEDGSMGVQPGSGANCTKAKFGDCKLHLEFYLPLMAGEFGQGRCNSGVYVENRYEVQVLDSFGVMPHTAGDCGSVYDISAALVNASLPPECWQTYDIDFRAARLNADGTLKEASRLTLRHNGILIQDNVALPLPTGGGVPGPGAAEDVLQLQDHGNKVRYRNIWFVPVKE